MNDGGAKMEAASLDGSLLHPVASTFPVSDDQLQPSRHSSCSDLLGGTGEPQYYAQTKDTTTL